MAATIDLTETAIFAALRSAILPLLPTGIEVIRGEINRVPEPLGTEFLVMTPISRERIETDWSLFDPNAGTMALTQPIKFNIQIDVHGPRAGDFSQIITTFLRSEPGVDAFAGSGVTPLDHDTPHQSVFINDEKQMEYSWVFGVDLQVNPIVTITQDSATIVSVGLIDVDVIYPPGV